MLEKLNLSDFDDVYKLLQENFNFDEYGTYNDQKELFTCPLYTPYGIKENNKIIVFISIWTLNNFSFIEHFLVDKNYRKKGLGTKTLNEVLKITNNLTCLEVEPPINELNIRRIEFYKRNGFYLNKYNYKQPSMASNKQPIDLLIMTFPKAIDEKEFNNIKLELYNSVYKKYIN